jgi:hypothetical protein
LVGCRIAVPPILVFIAFAAGIAVGALLAAIAMQRRRSALLHELRVRVLPVLERRAVTLDLPTHSAPQVNVSGDGDLQLETADPLTRVLRLADSIDEHEHAQLGFVDTIRVSKDEVYLSVGRSKRR